MNTKIQYEHALDKNGLRVSARLAPKGETYCCIACNDELTLKNSGKTGPRSRRPHFAHKPESNCSYENYDTYLHNTGKMILFEKIEKHINEKTELFIKVGCEKCRFNGRMTLVDNGISDVKCEYKLEGCRPDIALFDNMEILCTVIEIIVTKRPEEYAIQYYKKNGLFLIQIFLRSEEDLTRLDESVNVIEGISCFLSPCPNCEMIRNCEPRVNPLEVLRPTAKSARRGM